MAAHKKLKKKAVKKQVKKYNYVEIGKGSSGYKCSCYENTLYFTTKKEVFAWIERHLK